MFKFIKKLFNRRNKMLDKLGVLYDEDARIFNEKMEANNKNIGKETPENIEFDAEIWKRIIEKSQNKQQKPFINKNH